MISEFKCITGNIVTDHGNLVAVELIHGAICIEKLR